MMGIAHINPDRETLGAGHATRIESRNERMQEKKK